MTAADTTPDNPGGDIARVYAMLSAITELADRLEEEVESGAYALVTAIQACASVAKDHADEADEAIRRVTDTYGQSGAPHGVIHRLGEARQVGRRLVSARVGCWYPPAVEQPDLLDVDFDVHGFGDDGLYLLERRAVGPVQWRGCRRLAMTVTEGLTVDDDGKGDWRPVDLEAAGLRVVGYVCHVYKPAGAEGGAK